MPNQNYYNPEYFANPVHLKIGPSLTVNNLEEPYSSFIERRPIYVDTPLAYWKIYKSPYRPKIVLDHAHKPNGEWHNQGAWAVFTNVEAALHYIKEHDWEVKNCSREEPMFISSSLGMRRISEKIYCLTTGNEQIYEKVRHRLQPLSYFQDKPGLESGMLETAGEFQIYNTNNLKKMDHAFLEIVNKLKAVDIGKEFKVEVLERAAGQPSCRFESRGFMELPDVAAPIRKSIREQKRNPFMKYKQNIFLLNTHCLDSAAKQELSRRVSLAFGLAAEEAAEIIEQRKFFSYLLDESLALLAGICQDFGVVLKYISIDYYEVYRKEKLNGSRVTIIERNMAKLSKSLKEAEEYFLDELKIPKAIVDRILLGEGLETPFSLLITKGDQAEIKKALSKFGFKIGLERTMLSKFEF